MNVEHTHEALIASLGAIWMFMPWVLTAVAWRNSTKAGRPPDIPFLIGLSLATVSCCEVIPFLIPATTRWEQLRIDVMSYGALATALFTFVALFLLPFATVRRNWLAFASCIVNLLFVAIFLCFFVSMTGDKS